MAKLSFSICGAVMLAVAGGSSAPHEVSRYLRPSVEQIAAAPSTMHPLNSSLNSSLETEQRLVARVRDDVHREQSLQLTTPTRGTRCRSETRSSPSPTKMKTPSASATPNSLRRLKSAVTVLKQN
ncbi:hypothetical protein PF005_g25448, partial [Phytophthora fragariae]